MNIKLYAALVCGAIVGASGFAVLNAFVYIAGLVA